MRPVLSTHKSIPLPSSEEYKYAITGVDTAMGLLAAYPTWHPDQKAVIAAYG